MGSKRNPSFRVPTETFNGGSVTLSVRDKASFFREIELLINKLNKPSKQHILY
jgi:hypothetical protein